MAGMNALRKVSDAKLRLYQKFCLAILFPSLMSFFATTVALFIPTYTQGVALGLSAYLEALWKDNSLRILWTIVVGISLLALFAFLALKAAKGKVVFVYVGLGLYLGDTLLACFNRPSGEMTTYIVSLVVHLIFLVFMGLSLLFYYQTKRALQAEAAAK